MEIGSYSGHVRVYQRDLTSSSGWSQLGIDIDGEAAGDCSGYSVAISYSGNIVAIGARFNNGGGSKSGHTRVYIRDSTSLMGWVQVGNDVDGESRHNESGSAVALSANGDVLASGAIGNDNDDGSSGHVRVYETCRNVSLILQTNLVIQYHFHHSHIHSIVSNGTSASTESLIP